ncbi:patched domain-containing protein 3-like [Mytilus trossulus]|uniref:patched domain-containing protein 3-like n=1 Tax=Mytilus trossulus TaxID=6551 RepID=UPI0030046973
MACMFFSRCYTAHDRRLASFFGRYGRLIAKYPWHIVILSILINFLFGVGIINFELETNIEKQYFLENSQAFKDRAFLRTHFPSSENDFHAYSLPDYGCFVEVIIKSKNGRNIFENPVLAEFFNIDNLIKNDIVLKDGNISTYTFEDLCAKNNKRCVVFGEEVLHPSFISNMASKTVTFPLYKDILLSSILAQTTLKNGHVISANMVRLRYFLSQNPNSTDRLSKLWVKEFINYMENFKTNETSVVFMYYNAMEDEIQKSAMAEAHLFPLTLLLMIVYASIATAGKRIDCIHDLQNLGRIGVFCALLSLIPAVGIASAFGVRFMNSAATMPFLIIGIGINDMFIIMSGYADTMDKEKMSIDERMKRTLMTSGLAITVTSLTDVLTFFIGYTSEFNTIKNFCLYAGIAVFFCYLNQLTILAPCLVIHQRRIDSMKHSYTCHVTKPRKQLRKEGRSSCYVTCCSGEKPVSRSETESILETYPKRVVQFLVHNKISRLVILAVYATYITFSILGVQSIKQSTKYSELAIEGSNYYTANVWDYDNYPLELPFQIVFTGPVKYEKIEIRESIDEIVKKLKNNSLVRNDFEVNWLSSFIQYDGDNIHGNNFYTRLKQFVNMTNAFKNDIVYSDDGESVIASRIYLFSRNIRSTELQAEFLLFARAIAESSGLPCTIYTPIFVFCEQYIVLISSTLKTVGFAVTAMFIVTCIFMPHPSIVLIVTTSMISILLGVFGFLKLWGLDISVVTMIELIISVGFSVDFSAHICHAYLSSTSRDKQSRVREAIELAGGPIINGGLSTIVGLSMLLLSKSFIFQSFFKVLFLVVAFGLLHGVIILPIILSFIGPKVRILPEGKANAIIQSLLYNKPVEPALKPLILSTEGNCDDSNEPRNHVKCVQNGLDRT